MRALGGEMIDSGNVESVQFLLGLSHKLPVRFMSERLTPCIVPIKENTLTKHSTLAGVFAPRHSYLAFPSYCVITCSVIRVSRVDEPDLCWRYRENVHAVEFQAHHLCYREGALLRRPRIETPGIGTLLDQANQSVDSAFDTGYITVPASWLSETTLESTYMSSHPVPWLWERSRRQLEPCRQINTIG